jgi:hypothetical protein
MDWGLGNPNKTAALIAILMVAMWAIAYLHKWGFWVALAPFTALGVCLIHTVSRGGIVALGIGLTAVLCTIPRPWRIQKIVALVACFWVIVGTSVYLNTYSRYSQGIVNEDPSISNRIELWKMAPRMMVDAPAGWGLGNSGQAYMQWYQPLDRHEAYRTLVNSHLTWLVELSWPLRFVYLSGWSLILILCWPYRKGSWQAIIFGIWITFFVAASFSSVAESVWIWIVPVIGLVTVLADRFVHNRWPGLLIWTLPASLPAAILAAMFLCCGNNNITVKGSPDSVAIGTSTPKTWILINPRIMGSDYGRTLRSHYLPLSSIGLVTSLNSLANVQGDTIVICGALNGTEIQQIGSIVSNFKKVLLINPSFYPEEAKLNDPSKFEVLFGEFSQSPSIDAWGGFLQRPVSRLTGKGDFIPQWSLLLTDSGQSRAL